MSEASEILLLRKQLLQARATLCRVRIAAELSATQQRFGWLRGAGREALSGSLLPTLRTALIEFAIDRIGHAYLGKLVALASRTLLIARLSWVTVKCFWKT